MKKIYKTVNVEALDAFLNDGWSLEELSHPTAVVSRPAPKCPNCHRDKDDPALYKRADGHGGLNVWCHHPFHKEIENEESL